MIRRKGLPPVFWALFGFLVLAGFVISLGNRETETTPAVSNFSGSGVSALFTLLQRAGYKVVVNQASDPHLGPHDIAICMRQISHAAPFGPPMDEPVTEEAFKTSLTKFLKDGGRAVVFGYPEDFADESHQVLQSGAALVTDQVESKSLHIMDYNVAIPKEKLPVDLTTDDTATIWQEQNLPLVWASKVGKGSLVVCNSALPASNRFLDKADDAEFVLSTIDILAKPGDRLVFTEASFGNISEPGFFETLGTWAVAGWRQAIVLFLVLVFTLGKRFGYPEETRRVVQGSRDLADAFGNLLHRSKRVDLSIQTALMRLDQRLRTYFRIPRDASEGERNRVLPENIIAALSRLEQAGRDETTRPADALKLIQSAEKEIDAYLFFVTDEKSLNG